jgi:hypothetical protein
LFQYPLSNKMTDRYDDSHRLFVQSMLSKRIISEADAEMLYDKISTLTESKYGIWFLNGSKLTRFK